MTEARAHANRGVRVEDVVDQLDMQDEATQVYLDRDTHTFVTILDPLIHGDDITEDQPDPEDLDPQRFAPLPSTFDIHEWAILRDFCAGVEDTDLRPRLLRAVHGRGAFRATKDLLSEHGLLDAWYAARDRALERIARDWLDSLGLGSDLDETTEQ
ncbi:MAG: hypothetical protein EA416_00695 [Trueperaceae bacterium]|nr:MAG: hypothetical protein EA416_00695 [Trueperaceae bacterium]